MRAGSDRWHEVSPSEFTHEREGLEIVRELLPHRAPFRAWSNFEFRDGQGRWHEVDLLVIGERRLHLVELKHYRGRIGGNGYRWTRNGRSEDSPVLLTRRKAQRLAGVIGNKLKQLGWQGRAPWIQQSVFLHAEDCVVDLAPSDMTDLFGRPDREARSRLPGIGERLMESEVPGLGPVSGGSTAQSLITADDIIPRVLQEIGMVVRRERIVGSWRLTGPPQADGDDWQDWPAEHAQDQSHRARIRFVVPRPGASPAQVSARNALVTREYQLTRRLHHDGLLTPRDLVEHELGAGLVFDDSPQDRRLDLWLADNAGAVGITSKVAIVRQLAEALAYAHENHVVHRDLHPGAIVVTGPPTASMVRVGDWRQAGRDAGSTNPAVTTRLFRAMEGAIPVDADPAAAYRAPEGRFDAKDRIRVDVFALGAVAHHVMTGFPPARSATDLREKIQSTGGLDLAAVMPDVPGTLRHLIRSCTDPRVSARPQSMRDVLVMLDAVDREVAAPDQEVRDPLDAPTGTLIDRRFELRARLGKGSTAVGLLVSDREADGELRVLKVALDDAAGRRLLDEAAVLNTLHPLRSSRVVRMCDSRPLMLGSRTALLLESAGPETLADVLSEHRRLSIDLLERWGVDLGEALVTLDEAGVDHRDIKPANLGIREQPRDRARHLVLFDFSLAGAGAAAIEAGTPPYLDPFLGTATRQTWDSAAERYAAVVTLFEMATGTLPAFGDGLSNPAAIRDQATIDPGMFDPSIAGGLVEFFRRALNRDARRRFDTAADQLAAWRAVFTTPATTTVPDDADDRAERVTPDTPLAEAGLTARALSAVEPLGVHTVGDLAAEDPGRLSRLRGWADVTRREVRSRAKQWREKFPEAAARGRGSTATSPAGTGPLDDPAATVDVLVTAAGSARATAQRHMAALLLGSEGAVGAFAAMTELAAATGTSTPNTSNALGKVQQAWAKDAHSMDILDAVYTELVRVVDDGGGVMAATDAAAVLHQTSAAQPGSERLVAGLVRAALHRADEVARGGGDEPALHTRRRRSEHRDQGLLLARRRELLDAAGHLGETADALVAEARTQHQALVAAARAATELRRVWPTSGVTGPIEVPDDTRLVRCAARLSTTAAASRRGELHSRDLPAHDALAFAMAGLPASRQVTPDEVAQYVQARFPALAPLPRRPELDAVVARSELGLRWDDGSHRYVARSSGMTTGLEPRPPTIHTTVARGIETPDKAAFSDSRSSRSFLAVVCGMQRVDLAARNLIEQFDATVVDIADVLVAELRAEALAKGIDWAAVRSADAADRNSRAGRGLAVLVREAAPRVEAAVAAAAAREPAGQHPVVVTEAGILSRYGHQEMVARWADISAGRNQAIWVLVPEVDGAATLDGEPLGLSHAGQLVQAPRWAYNAA